MRKLKMFLAIGCATVMVVTAAGCSSTSSDAVEETTQTETTDTTQDETTADTDNSTVTNEVDDSVVFGKVTAIDGSDITLALGEMAQGNNMDGKEAPSGDSNSTGGQTASTEAPSGEAPSGDANAAGGQAPSGEAPSGEAPSGDANAAGGQAPSGEAPSGDTNAAGGQAPDMSTLFTESGETTTITVDDESIIKLVSGTETTTGSLSDITVDTILSIEYDDSDNITSITIQGN
ncbi:hypothetical protein C8E03_101694 [Lachnotalea glycerini]|uniref:DUF5666 domain-containing protein n=1 Tax=Lachnotalea glycerini TaxID=1763509 RepID=A0A318EST7_9FIRM|nr:hypothetical protein [Lachnotalea glycerini]PXV96061.1 hypothetical protein C8E03_101694 [Lachnotalea glycerini]